MLTHAYIEAVIRDGTLADAIWEIWNRGLIDDALAVWLWFQVVAAVERNNSVNTDTPHQSRNNWTGPALHQVGHTPDSEI